MQKPRKFCNVASRILQNPHISCESHEYGVKTTKTVRKPREYRAKTISIERKSRKSFNSHANRGLIATETVQNQRKTSDKREKRKKKTYNSHGIQPRNPHEMHEYRSKVNADASSFRPPFLLCGVRVFRLFLMRRGSFNVVVRFQRLGHGWFGVLATSWLVTQLSCR